MQYRKFIIALMAALFTVLFTVGALASHKEEKIAKPDSQEVRIGIREGRSNVSFLGPQGLTVYRNGKEWKKIPANTPVYVSIQGKQLAVNGTAGAGNVILRPTKRGGAVKITDGYAYRGAIEVIPSPNVWGLTVVNVVPLEQYLYGVVGKEMSPSWNMEALKAQAVAARTYAVAHKNYFQKRGYDMADDTRSQVYSGLNGEAPSIIQAVNATSGEILTYQGKPIQALFHSNGGGWTENSENVWGSSIAYLRGVSDKTQETPAYRWSVTTTPEQLAEKLNAASKGVGQVQSIVLSPLTKRPMSVPDRGVSGRVLTLTIKGTKGQVTLTGNGFQAIFGLKSTLFDFTVATGLPPDPDVTKPKRATEFKVRPAQKLMIYGFGWGHGLGMSQYGANEMAKEHSQDDTYYRQILQHYYTGTKIERVK